MVPCRPSLAKSISIPYPLYPVEATQTLICTFDPIHSSFCMEFAIESSAKTSSTIRRGSCTSKDEKGPSPGSDIMLCIYVSRDNESNFCICMVLPTLMQRQSDALNYFFWRLCFVAEALTILTYEYDLLYRPGIRKRTPPRRCALRCVVFVAPHLLGIKQHRGASHDAAASRLQLRQVLRMEGEDT